MGMSISGNRVCVCVRENVRESKRASENVLNLNMVPDVQLRGYTKNPLNYTFQIGKLYGM